METNKALDKLFSPKSLAIIGASNNLGKSAGRFVDSLIRNRFNGPVYPVNPKEKEIMGLKSYPSVLDIPGEIDLAIITIGARAIPDIITECAEKNIESVIVFSGGFSELGAGGKEIEDQVVARAREGGVRIIGPNCLGVFNPEIGLNTIAAHEEISFESGGYSFIGQSGWGSANFISTGHDRGFGFSKVISCGNQADLTVTDYVRYLGNDPKTKFIGIYLEGVADGRGFMREALKASARKPIVVWKSGKSKTGARMAASHTAALAGTDALWEAAFNQAGIIRAGNFEELMDFAAGFGCPYLPAGDRVSFIGGAGGGAVAASDACETLGLQVDMFSEETQDRLRDCLKGFAAPFTNVRNPIDLVSLPRSDYPQVIPRLLEVMASVTDAIIHFTYYPLSYPALPEILEELRDKIKKPIITIPGYPSQQAEGMARYNRLGLPVLPTPERAVKTLAALRRYARHLERRKD